MTDPAETTRKKRRASVIAAVGMRAYIDNGRSAGDVIRAVAAMLAEVENNIARVIKEQKK